MFAAVYMVRQEALRKEACALFRKTGRWPHQACAKSGFDFAEDVKQKNFFKPFAVPIAKIVATRSIYDALATESKVSANANANDKNKNKGDENAEGAPWVAVQFVKIPGQPGRIWLTDAVVTKMMATHWESVTGPNKDEFFFTGIHQKPRKPTQCYPLFFDFDEKVTAPIDFWKTDCFIESFVAAFIEMVFPGAEWWWLRPDSVREDESVSKTTSNGTEYRKFVKTGKYKGGVHVHVRALVTAARACAIFKMAQEYFGEQLRTKLPWLDMDEVTFSKTGLRSPFVYKSVHCSEITNKKCLISCERGCMSSSEMIIAPMYSLVGAHCTVDHFLYSSLYSPENGEPTRAALEIEKLLSEVCGTGHHRFTGPRSQRIFNATIQTMLGDLRLQQEGGVALNLAGPELRLVQDIIFTRPSTMPRRHDQSQHHIKDIYECRKEGRDDCIIVQMRETYCVIASSETRENHTHSSTNNTNYYLFSLNGNVYVGCYSRKRDSCKKLYKFTTLEDREFALLFPGKTRAVGRPPPVIDSSQGSQPPSAPTPANSDQPPREHERIVEEDYTFMSPLAQQRLNDAMNRPLPKFLQDLKNEK